MRFGGKCAAIPIRLLPEHRITNGEVYDVVCSEVSDARQKLPGYTSPSKPNSFCRQGNKSGQYTNSAKNDAQSCAIAIPSSKITLSKHKTGSPQTAEIGSLSNLGHSLSAFRVNGVACHPCHPSKLKFGNLMVCNALAS